jgi:hypothetical protein
LCGPPAATPANAQRIQIEGLLPHNGKVYLGLLDTCARFRATKTPVIFRVIVPSGIEVHDTGFEMDEIYVREAFPAGRLTPFSQWLFFTI